MKRMHKVITVLAIGALVVPLALAQGRGGHGFRGGRGGEGGACCAMQEGKSPQCCGSETTDSQACCAGEAASQREGQKSHRELMRDAHTLVFNNDLVQRTVEEIPGGVRTVTTTSDPELLKVLQRHPKEMGDYYKDGGMVRGWDPVFRALAQHADKVEMEVKPIENGVEVTSTSEDEYVAKLIRAHAYKVSEFVERGRTAMHEATPLPEESGN